MELTEIESPLARVTTAVTHRYSEIDERGLHQPTSPSPDCPGYLHLASPPLQPARQNLNPTGLRARSRTCSRCRSRYRRTRRLTTTTSRCFIAIATMRRAALPPRTTARRAAPQRHREQCSPDHARAIEDGRLGRRVEGRRMHRVRRPASAQCAHAVCRSVIVATDIYQDGTTKDLAGVTPHSYEWTTKVSVTPSHKIEGAGRRKT